MADSARPLAYGLFFGVFHVEETFCGDRAIIELKTTRIFKNAILRPKMGEIFFKFLYFVIDMATRGRYDKKEQPGNFQHFIEGEESTLALRNEQLMAALVRNEGSKMTGGTKKILKKLVCAGIVTLALVGCAKATLVDANAVEKGLEYYIRIDKGVYDLGEPIEMLSRLTNVRDEIFNVAEFGIYSISFELTRPEGDTLFATYFGPPFPPMPPGLPDIISLNPGEYIETLWPITSDRWGTDGEWVEEPFSTVGQYSISSKYVTFILIGGPSSLVSGPLDFEIIPEPAGIALLGLGLASLLVRKKGRAKCLNLKWPVNRRKA